MYTQKEVIYHRGRHGTLSYQPNIPLIVRQNSLAAMIEAMREGASMVEFDARKGNDPLEPVIAHDPDEDDAPTLRDVMLTLNGNMSVNIEIKDPVMCAAALAIVNEGVSNGSWRAEQIVFSSFHHETVSFIKAIFPKYQVGAIIDGVPFVSYIDMLAKRGIENLHMEWMNADMDMQNGSAVMKRAKQLGMQVWVWTVNDLATAERVFSWGADRIFTDRPDLFPR